jgi:hypothetical protein
MANPTEPTTARDAIPTDKSDTAIVPFDALVVGGIGDVKIRTKAGETRVLPVVNAGQIWPVGGDKIFSTDTDATDIVRLIY